MEHLVYFVLFVYLSMELTWINARTDIIMGTGSMGNTESMGMEGSISMDMENKSKYTFCHAERSEASCLY